MKTRRDRWKGGLVCSKLFLSLLGCFGLCASLLGQNTYNLPQVANGTGIQTTFIFFNNADVDASVQMHIRGDDGAFLDMNIPGFGETNPYEFMLAAGQTRFFLSDGRGPIQVGAAQVTSTVDIGVSAIFSLVAGSAGAGITPKTATQIITEAGVDTSEATTEFAIFVDTMGAFNTGVAIQNLVGVENDLTFTLFDTEGKPQGTPVSLTLAGRGHLAVFVGGPNGLFPNLGDFRGKMVVTATSNVAGLTLRQKADTGSPLTTLPVVSTDSTQSRFILPQVAIGTGIRTSFVFFNISSSETANVTMTLTQDDGSPLTVNFSSGQRGSTFNFQIPPCGAVLVETTDTGTVLAGAAVVSSNVPIGVSAIFTLLDAKRGISTEAGVGDSPELSDFSLPVDLTSGFNTGMALFNNNADPANLQVTFVNQDGSVAPQERVQLTIDPFSLASLNHLARFITDLIQGLGEVQGQLRVVSSLPVAALTLRQGATTLTTLPVKGAVPPQGQAPSDQLYVTNSGDGSISVVDLTSSAAVVDTIRVGTNPLLVSVLPSLNRAYVGDFSENAIHVINTTTREAVGSITLSRPSGGGDVDPASRTLFVLDLGNGSPGTNMHVIDASTNTETADIPIGTDLSDIRIDPAANRGYVTDFTEGVKVIDLADNTVLNTIGVGNGPHGLAIDSDESIVYVTQVEGESVSVIDVEAGVIVDVIPVGRVPQWIALNASRTKAYVTNEEDGTVSVIDTDTRIATNTIAVGKNPFFILIDPRTDIAYVSNNGSNTVSILDTKSDTVVDTVNVGTEPIGLAIVPRSAQ